MAMTDIGFDAIRAYLKDTYVTQLSVKNGAGTELFKVAKANGRVTITDNNPITNQVTWKLLLTGSDAEITLGTTSVQEMSILNAANEVIDTFRYASAFVFAGLGDTYTMELTLDIKVKP